MKCLTPEDVEQMLGADGFKVVLGYRKALRLREDIRIGLSRIGGRAAFDATQLPSFIISINRWLPTNRCRILWVEHWDSFHPSIYDIFSSARNGMGEVRSLAESPGHYFSPHDYAHEDQAEVPVEQVNDVNILVGLMSLVIIGGWDAVLVAESCVDTIEFWEGNIIFNSEDTTRLDGAKALLSAFDCPIGIR